MLKRIYASTIVTAAAVLAVSSFAHAAPIASGDVIAVDLSTGGGAATNYNPFNANGAIGTGSVVRLSDNATVDGVSLTFAGAGGFNNDGNADSWAGTGADPYYTGFADDISFGGTQTLTYIGLDPTLKYNVRVYSLIGNNGATRETFTVTDGAGTTGIANLRRDTRWNAATLEAGGTVFNGVSTDASGNIAVSTTPVDSNAFLNAVTLEAVTPVIAYGTKIGLDFGPTATDTFGNDWNEITSNSTIAAGNVIDLNGHALDGVSVTTSGAAGFNNDGTNSWNGLSTNGGDAPSEFVESVVTDISFAGGSVQTVTINGLDDSLSYDIDAVSVAVGSATEVLTINGVEMSQFTRPDARDNGVFHSFKGIESNGGTITMVFSQAPGTNAIINGILIEAVPAPAALPAGLAMLGLVAARRRRRK